MTGHVLVSGLRVQTRIGWTAEERAKPQVVLIDLDVEVDLEAAALTDDLSGTLDYDTTISEVAAFVRGRETKLLERLASEIGELVSAKNGVKSVSVEIGKEVVPVAEEVARVAVRIARSN